MKKKKNSIWWIILLFMVLLSGCNSERREVADNQNGELANTGQINYLVQETVIPNPDKSLTDFLEEGDDIWELEYCVQGDSIYRLVQLRGEREIGGKIIDDYDYAYYIQIFESPYKEWKSYEVKSQYWNPEMPYKCYNTMGLKVGTNGEVYCIVDGPGENTSTWVKYLAKWNREGEGELLGQLKNLSENALWCIAGHRIYTYTFMDSQVTLWDEQMQNKQTFYTDGQVWGVIYYPKDGHIYWYGVEDEKFGIYAVESKKNLIKDCNGINSFAPDMIYTALSPEGELYLSDHLNLWKVTKNGTENLCVYRELNYPLTALKGMSVLENGSVLLVVEMTDGDYLLRLTEGEMGVRQEIILATAQRTPNLTNALRCFNRQNEKYYVTLSQPEDEESWEAFQNRMQIEVSSGGGADLFYDEAMNVIGFARNGYLSDLEYLLENKTEIYEPTLEAGVIDGVQYGVPYMWRMLGTAFDKRIVGDRDAWTLAEFIEAVRSSDAKMIQAGYDGIEIVLWYGLYDKGNKELIDWEAGESHLAESSFLELLEFAAEYADTNQNREEIEYDDEVKGTLYKEGKIAGEWINIQCPADVNYVEAMFGGEASFIGFPRVEGMGNYAYVFQFYMNANTKKKEGAEEFLRFILSDEMQRYNVRQSTVGGWKDELPIRKTLLEYCIECSRETVNEEAFLVRNGISYNPTEFTGSEEKQFRFLLENIRPLIIDSVIDEMVSEELAPFFAGQKSAEQVAEVLNNRVQLYLDERN